jgi:hypothetical protein
LTLGQEQVFLEAGDLRVGVELLAPVDALGGLGEHLNDHAGAAAEVGLVVFRVAGEQPAGVVEGRLARRLDALLHVGCEELAAGPAEVGPKGKKVTGNGPMPVAGADRGVDFPADVFMPDLAR